MGPRLGWVVFAIAWMAPSALLFVDPHLLLLFFPLTGLALFACWLLAIRTYNGSVIYMEPALVPRRVRVAVIATMVIAALGATAAMLPSFAVVIRYRTQPDLVALSTVVAPICFALVWIFALRVLRVPSPRRFAALVLTTYTVWPALVGLHMARTFGLDPEYLPRTTWVLDAYDAATALVSGFAIGFAFIANQLGNGPVAMVPPPPTATLLSD